MDWDKLKNLTKGKSLLALAVLGLTILFVFVFDTVYAGDVAITNGLVLLFVLVALAICLIGRALYRKFCERAGEKES